MKTLKRKHRVRHRGYCRVCPPMEARRVSHKCNICLDFVCLEHRKSCGACEDCYHNTNYTSPCKDEDCPYDPY